MFSDREALPVHIKNTLLLEPEEPINVTYYTHEYYSYIMSIVLLLTLLYRANLGSYFSGLLFIDSIQAVRWHFVWTVSNDDYDTSLMITTKLSKFAKLSTTRI